MAGQPNISFTLSRKVVASLTKASIKHFASLLARRQTKYESHKSSLIYSRRNPSIAL